jgi:Domain of unknown function (DUF4412)
MRTKFALIAPALLLAAAAQAGDLTVRQRTTTGGGRNAQTREETQYAHGNTLVIDGPDERTIVDVGARTMTIADKRRKTYFVLTFDQMRSQADAVQKKLQDMPRQERGMMDEMLGNGAPVTLQPTGKKETIAGYEATEYALAGGPFHGTVWTTEALSLPEGVRKWRELSASATAQQGPGRQLAEALAHAKGVPLRTTMTATIGPGTFSTSTEAIQVSTAPPPPDALVVPPGFTKTVPPPMP